ncbi:DNA primase [Streptomyces sp. NBC_01431]|uniref:DNA primase n=1 Tax=Streptomyces sp. NBC_01431 TaxID=2903863 RepID=UPI002E2EBB6E|nr:DNA primase [Streptomyces sp. NBC_01431]
MNNRLGLGLAVGAGYLLGRTKKAKLAFGIGTLVMGKRLQLNPRALADFATAQLAENPQFKEIGDQLREDLRGVGKAATGALLNRQIEGLADRLHDRTLDVQDRISGVTPDVSAASDEEEDEDGDQHEGENEDEDGTSAGRGEGSAGRRQRAPAKKASAARSSSAKSARSSAAGKSGGTAKSAPKSSAAKKTAKSVQRTVKRTPAKKASSRRSSRGGDGRD